MNTTFTLESFRKTIEESIKETFTKEIDEAIDKEYHDACKRLEVKFDYIRKDARMAANKAVLNLMQKVDLNGISVEFKI